MFMYKHWKRKDTHDGSIKKNEGKQIVVNNETVYLARKKNTRTRPNGK